jgi:hypothetical protein
MSDFESAPIYIDCLIGFFIFISRIKTKKHLHRLHLLDFFLFLLQFPMFSIGWIQTYSEKNKLQGRMSSQSDL